MLFMVMTFAASTLYVEHRVGRVDHEVENIIGISAPSVRELSAARTELRRIETGVGRQIGARLGNLPSDRWRLAGWRASLERHLAIYERLPFYEGERELYLQLKTVMVDIFSGVDRALALTDADQIVEARKVIRFEIDGSVERADHLIQQLESINNDRALESAVTIAKIRRRATIVAELLDSGSALMALVLALFTVRTVRITQRLRDQERKLAEQRAEELDRFSAVAAHDLKTPLASIMINSELALEAPELSERSLAKIRRAARSMGTMIDALLEVARGELQKPGATSVAAVLNEVVEQLTPLARDKNIEISVEPFARELTTECGAGVLSSVLGNLLQNAVKYAGGGEHPVARVIVRVGLRGRFVRCEIEDNGPGVPAGMERAIFDTFVRGDRSAVTPGLGLGLATVKRLVESNHGRVGFAPAPQRGSLFWIELPRADVV